MAGRTDNAGNPVQGHPAFPLKGVAGIGVGPDVRTHQVGPHSSSPVDGPISASTGAVSSYDKGESAKKGS